MLDDSTVYSNLADANIPGAAWNTFSGAGAGVQSGTDLTLEKYWDGTQAKSDGTAKVSYEAANMWNGPDRDVPYLVGYLDDGGHNGVNGPTVRVTGIPYEVYDVIIYANTDNGSNDKVFRPVTVNGISYTYANGATVGGTANWGGRQDALEEGKNALRVTGLAGTLHIQGGQHTAGGRGCIAAIQIVKSEEEATKPAALDFSYGPNPATAPMGWFTAWQTADGTKLGTSRMIGPEGVDAIAVGPNDFPAQNLTSPFPKDVTVMAVVNVDNVAVADDRWAVIWSLGRFGDGELGYALTKHKGKLYLQQIYRKSSNHHYRFSPAAEGSTDNHDSDGDGVAYCVSEELTPGYHVVIGVFDVTNDKLTLAIDGVRSVSVKDNSTTATPTTHGASLETLNGRSQNVGLRLGAAFGDMADPLVDATGAAFDRVMAWDSALTDVQLAELWNMYSYLTDSPIVPSYNTAFEKDGAKYYIPSIEKEGYQLKINQGTMVIPSVATATVSSVWLGNSANDLTYGLDIAGVLNVDSDTGYQIYRVDNQGTANGLLLGHWHGHGTVNVTGTLAATNAFIETAYTINELVFNINSGTVTTRGLYAQNDNSVINVSNGGTLEFAHFQNSHPIPLNAAKGTIKATASGEYTTGWKYNGAVSFTDATDGTTLDPNGKDIEFLSVATFSGNIVVDDSSEAKNGTVKLDAVSGTGTFAVLSGALYLPVGHGLTAEEGTIEDPQGSTAEYTKYVNKDYVAAYVAKAQKAGEETETYFYTVAAAIASLNSEAGTVTLLANAAAESVTLAEGQVINTGGFAIGTVTAANGGVIGLVGGVYTAYDVNVGEEWTGLGTDDRWTTAANWDKGFVPLATTPVMFPATAKEGGWTVTLTTGNNDTEQCKTLTIAGDVQFNRVGGWTELYVKGDVDGAGTLTLNYTGLRNMADADLEIKCPLVIIGGDTVIRAQDTYGWTISKSFELKGYLKVQNATFIDVTCPTVIAPTADTTLGLIATLTFKDKVTLGGNVKIDHWGNGVAYFGEVEVTGDATFTNQSEFIHLDGEVTVDTGKTLTIPANVNVDDDASFKLELGAWLVDGTKSLTIDEIGSAEEGYVVREIQDGVWRAVKEATWTGNAGDKNWTTAGNWSTEEVPTETTFVTIPSGGAEIAIYEHNDDNHNLFEVCAGIALDGDLTLTWGYAGGGGWPVLYMYGGVSGEGTLTLNRACLNNQTVSEQTISAPLVVAEDSRGDSSLLGNSGWNVSGGLTVQNGGYFVVRDHALNVTGATTIEQGAKLGPAGVAMVFNGTTTFNGSFERGDAGNSGMTFGNVEVAASTTLPGDSNITLNGTVTIAAKQTLTIPASATIGDDATFVLAGFGAKLVDNDGLVAEGKVTTSIEKGARIVSTTDGTTTTYRLRPVGFTVRLK